MDNIRQPQEGDSSPWGEIQQADQLAEGVVEVHTASHGGIWLSPERLAQMPEGQVSSDGWYEEDSEAAFPLFRFIDELELGLAPDKHEQFTAAVSKAVDRMPFSKITMNRVPSAADWERLRQAGGLLEERREGIATPAV